MVPFFAESSFFNSHSFKIVFWKLSRLSLSIFLPRNSNFSFALILDQYSESNFGKKLSIIWVTEYLTLIPSTV